MAGALLSGPIVARYEEILLVSRKRCRQLISWSRHRGYANRGCLTVGTAASRKNTQYGLNHERPCTLPEIPRRLLKHIVSFSSGLSRCFVRPCARVCEEKSRETLCGCVVWYICFGNPTAVLLSRLLLAAIIPVIIVIILRITLIMIRTFYVTIWLCCVIAWRYCQPGITHSP